jgi:hypothetical protein
MAEDLPRTKLSEHLEKHVREKFKNEMERLAKERAEAEVSSWWDGTSPTRLVTQAG